MLLVQPQYSPKSTIASVGFNRSVTVKRELNVLASGKKTRRPPTLYVSTGVSLPVCNTKSPPRSLERSPRSAPSLPIRIPSPPVSPPVESKLVWFSKRSVKRKKKIAKLQTQYETKRLDDERKDIEPPCTPPDDDDGMLFDLEL
jgi:hypothetical protein